MRQILRLEFLHVHQKQQSMKPECWNNELRVSKILRQRLLLSIKAFNSNSKQQQYLRQYWSNVRDILKLKIHTYFKNQDLLTLIFH